MTIPHTNIMDGDFVRLLTKIELLQIEYKDRPERLEVEAERLIREASND